jgi:HEPN domain-containing protein
MDVKKLEFVYGFDCSKDLEHFDKLPPEAQANIERYIVQTIVESFVIPADEDYLTARFLAHKKMSRAFFWSAAQALEKYFKAFLLMNGVGVKKNSHGIMGLYSKACEFDQDIRRIGAEPHRSISILPEYAELFSKLDANEFIANVDEYGSPDSRYNSFGFNFDSRYLFGLDNFAFGLRGKIGVPPIGESFSKLDSAAVEEFYYYNPAFSGQEGDLDPIPNENYGPDVHWRSTKLDSLISDNAPMHSNFILEWLDKKMKLPNKVREKLNKG